MVTVSAPGKLLLFGEHAVVYGHPCLVTAIDSRVSVSVEKTDSEGVQVESPQSTDTRFVDAAIAKSLTAWNVTARGLRLRTASDFTSSVGFGSSSAVTVAAIGALGEFFGKKIPLGEIFQLARQAIVDVQGGGSGFDVAAATWGGTLFYEKTMSKPEGIDGSSMPLVIGYTGVKADTMTLVQEVAKKKDADSQKVNRIFSAIAGLVTDAKAKIQEGDWERVGRLMDFNQEYLRDLGVSSEKLEALISAAKAAGAWGAKLSGAGGGDCMIAVVSAEIRLEVEQAIEASGGQVIHILPNAPGVRRDA